MQNTDTCSQDENAYSRKNTKSLGGAPQVSSFTVFVDEPQEKQAKCSRKPAKPLQEAEPALIESVTAVPAAARAPLSVVPTEASVISLEDSATIGNT